MSNPRFKHNLILFLVGLGAFTQARFLVGFFSFSEVALTLFAPIALLKNWTRIRKGYLFIFLLLFCLWFTSAVISDYYNGSIFYQYSRGLARIILFAGCLISMHYLIGRNISGFKWYALGMAISVFLGFFVFKAGTIAAVEEFIGERGLDYQGTFNYIIGACLFCFIAFTYGRFPMIAISTCFVIGIVDMKFGSRSAGAIKILVSFAMYFYYWQAKDGLRKRFNLSAVKMLVFSILILLLATLVFNGYRYLASSGALGQDQQDRFFRQAQGTMGLILGGRSEVYAAVLAVLDKPFLGHGSNALDKQGYRAKTMFDLGLEYRPDIHARHGMLAPIPAHSHLFQAWVEHGIAGAAFWVYLLVFFVRFLKKSILAYPALTGITVYIIFSAFWHYIFSPFGFRVPLAANIALIIAIADHQKFVLKSLSTNRFGRM